MAGFVCTSNDYIKCNLYYLQSGKLTLAQFHNFNIKNSSFIIQLVNFASTF